MESESKLKRQSDLTANSEHTRVPEFEPGAYVMVWWQNQYEYLAEVLAYRQRSRKTPEYRIKFLWDRIIEWTPASRIRRARPSEISYVLKFIRQHQHNYSIKKEHTELDKKPTVEISKNAIDGSDVRNDIVYDRSVAHFYETCRKRRELKKRSLITENDKGKPSKIVKLLPGEISSPSKSRAVKTVSNKSDKEETTIDKATVAPATNVDQRPKAIPVTYQCPHCPRILRRQNLLAAHLHNYHREQSDTPQQLPECPIHEIKVDVSSTNQTLIEETKQERHVFCSTCKFSGSSTESLDNLIQCCVCRVFSHKFCTTSHVTPWTCDSCFRGPSRSFYPKWLITQEADSSSIELVNSDTNNPPSLAQLIRETTSLLSWIHNLHSLIKVGQHRLCRIKRTTNNGCVPRRQSTAVVAAAQKESCGDASNEVVMDFPLVSGPQSVGGDEHFNAFFLQIGGLDNLSHETESACSSQRNSTNRLFPQPTVSTTCASALEPTDVSRILATLATNPPEYLPDLITGISDDLLNVSTTPNQPVNSQSLGSPNQALLSSNLALDTPTKSLLACIDPDMANGTSKLFSPINTSISDFLKSLSTEASPYVTPMKNPHISSCYTGVRDIEVAPSLNSPAEISLRGDFGMPLSSTTVTTPLTESKAPKKPSDLESLQSEIIVPVEDMLALIDTRLDVIEAQVVEAKKRQEC